MRYCVNEVLLKIGIAKTKYCVNEVLLKLGIA